MDWKEEMILKHHGVDGQKWGQQNGPPYPLDSKGKAALKKQRKEEAKIAKATRKAYMKRNFQAEAKQMSNDELKEAIAKLENEKRYLELMTAERQRGKTAFEKSTEIFMNTLTTQIPSDLARNISKTGTDVIFDKLKKELTKDSDQAKKDMAIKAQTKGLTDEELKAQVKRLNSENAYFIAYKERFKELGV